jgi:hypothetical protein
MLLRGFQFTVEHVPGETNELPDALSRFTGGSTFREDERDMERFLPPTRQETDKPVTLAHVSADDIERRLIEAQWDDIWLNEV